MKKMVFMVLGLWLPLHGLSQTLDDFKKQIGQEAVDQGVRPEIIQSYLLPAKVLVRSKKNK